MTAQQYIAKGFAVSAHIEQAIIDRAEQDARAAYITPIVGAPTTQEASEVTDALANLAFLLMLQRGSVFATRSGAKTKQTNDSREADTWSTLQEQAHTCAMKVEALRNLDGANKTAQVTDICRIYFSTNFLYS